MPIAIKIENLSKQYRLGLVSTRTLSHDLNRWVQTTIRGKADPYLKIGDASTPLSIRQRSDYMWALNDINLEVQQGEVLGIIGKNGAIMGMTKTEIFRYNCNLSCLTFI